MKPSFLVNRLSVILIITLILLSFNNSYGQASKDMWSEIIKEHKLDRKYFRVIDQVIILSDSISETADQIFFDRPAYISKGKDNYYIYICDSVILSKNDTVVTLFSGFDVGFSKIDNLNKPISISEFDKITSDIKNNRSLVIQYHKGFYWHDDSYFSKKNYQISTKKADN
jgi:hypothetical protein